MRIYQFLLILSLLSSTTCFSEETKGSITLEGRGSSSSQPEAVSFSIGVVSICYESSQAAAQANSDVARRVLDILQKFKRTDRDRVTATGGANVLQTETTQVGLESKVLCEMKWHSENFLKIQMSSIEDLPDLQDQVLQAINGTGRIDPTTATQTFAELGRPEFYLHRETSQNLRAEAQTRAFDDAEAQLRSLLSRCHFENLRLIRVSPSDYSYVYKLAGERIPTHESAAPVIPDELEVQATLQMEWAFDPTSTCKFQ